MRARGQTQGAKAKGVRTEPAWHSSTASEPGSVPAWPIRFLPSLYRGPPLYLASTTIWNHAMTLESITALGPMLCTRRCMKQRGRPRKPPHPQSG